MQTERGLSIQTPGLADSTAYLSSSVASSSEMSSTYRTIGTSDPRSNMLNAGTRSRKYTVRACLLGEAGSGKSSLFYRVKYKAFRDCPEELEKTRTISVGPCSRTRFYDSYSTVRRPDKKTKINLTLMDTGSRERYQSLTAQYYSRANIIILVCSLDSEFTLTRLTKWHAEAQYYIDNSEITFAVVGTKSDLPETEREVSMGMLHGFARHVNIPRNFVFEISSQTGSGVEELLTSLCDAVVNQFLQTSRIVKPVYETTLLLSNHVSDSDNSLDSIPDQRGSINSPKQKLYVSSPTSTCCGCSIL